MNRPFPLEGRVEAILRRDAEVDWRPTGWRREDYLDLMERIVRPALAWQDPQTGATIDPVLGKEWGQTTSRFASSAAILRKFDRLPEAQPHLEKALDWVCARLPRGEMNSPDFQTREIMTALICIADRASPADLQRWRSGIASIVPEKVYRFVSPDGTGIEKLHNWTVYFCAGEIMRAQEGLAPPAGVLWGTELFDKYIPVQLQHHVSEYGMYRDPNDPITYDIVTRLQLAIALEYGYQGPHREAVSEMLRRGALTMLMYLTPDGITPFGGRSDQFAFREAAVAALCEFEAKRYAGHQNPTLAGAFKRQARRSVMATQRWLRMTPLRHIKNAFDPGRVWGTDGYGHYSVYSLLTSSLLGLAAMFADESIEEFVTPAEVGGFTIELNPAFHKVYSNCRGMYVSVDTSADLHYNATGLGSIQRMGVPTEAALAMPFTATPEFRLEREYYPKRPAAIGVEWQHGETWHRLAEQSSGVQAKSSILEDTPQRQRFRIVYNTPVGAIDEEYTLSDGQVQLQTTVRLPDGSPPTNCRMLIPIIQTDGQARSTVDVGQEKAIVRYRDAQYTIHYPPAAKAVVEDGDFGNRNGVYRLLAIDYAGPSATVTLQLNVASEQQE